MAGVSRPPSLQGFIERKGEPAYAAQVVNRTDHRTIAEMLDRLFGGLDIDTTETAIGGVDQDLLLIMRDGEVVASSPLQTIKDTLLLVNSDRYMTGTQPLDDVLIPDVILELSDTVFTVDGYPASHTEKLVLTLVARYIERRALRQATGRLRASFQRLSRLDDEQGTREVYERLGQTDGLTTHVYGVPDWTPPDAYGLDVTGVADDEILNHWFVVYTAAEGSVAMLATRVGANRWTGYWTFSTDEIEAIDRYIAETF